MYPCLYTCSYVNTHKVSGPCVCYPPHPSFAGYRAKMKAKEMQPKTAAYSIYVTLGWSKKDC